MRIPCDARAAVLAITLLAYGCSSDRPAENVVEASQESIHPVILVADLSPTAGHTVRGTVTLTQEPGGVHIVAELAGLTPGEHGFHILEDADCSAAGGSSADRHFNPTDAPHGAPAAEQRHAGDLGNLVADASGNARYDRVDPRLSLEGPESVVGRAIVVHDGADDSTSQPGGKAGPRAACGVIVPLGING